MGKKKTDEKLLMIDSSAQRIKLKSGKLRSAYIELDSIRKQDNTQPKNNEYVFEF